MTTNNRKHLRLISSADSPSPADLPASALIGKMRRWYNSPPSLPVILQRFLTKADASPDRSAPLTEFLAYGLSKSRTDGDPALLFVAKGGLDTWELPWQFEPYLEPVTVQTESLRNPKSAYPVTGATILPSSSSGLELPALLLDAGAARTILVAQRSRTPGLRLLIGSIIIGILFAALGSILGIQYPWTLFGSLPAVIALLTLLDSRPKRDSLEIPKSLVHRLYLGPELESAQHPGTHLPEISQRS